MEKYDVMVIGGGTAGLRTAIMCSKKTKTLMIEPGVLGGTCLNTGCIPTKAMIYASHLYQLSKEMDYFGIKAKSQVDIKKLLKRVNSISKEGRDHIYAGLEKNKNLVLVKEKAKFVGKKQVKVDNKIYTAKHIIIATGAKNFVPPIPGLVETGYLDNESVLELKKLPKSIVMIGGGYISIEYASFFSALGVKVTVLEMLPDVLGMLDEDIREVLLKSHEKENINIITNAKIHEIKKGLVIYNDLREESSKKINLKIDAVFLATGRVPNTNELDLEKSSINFGRRGDITINNSLETSCKGIYAIGDCNGHPMFAHSAKRQTKIVLNNVFSEKKLKMNFSLVPWATFSQPVVAGVGLSEKQAQEKNIEYEIMKAKYSRNGRAKIIEKQQGFVKVLYNKKSRKIIGASIIGPNADDIIHELVALIYANAKIDVLKEIIHIHPTLSEVMENLK